MRQINSYDRTEYEIEFVEVFLPYASVDDLPTAIRAHLPPHAQEIYRSAFNNAWTEYASRGPSLREETAHRVAWAAVKRKYRKYGSQWVLRAG